MTTEVIRYCVDIDKTGSFTKTAEKYHLTQQAMSQQIKNLECELGFQLFIRNNKTVMTTEAGKAFLREGEVVLDLLESSCRTAKAYSDGNKGFVRIGFNGPSSKRYLSEISREFSAVHPEIQLQPKLETQSELYRKIGYGVYDLITAGDFVDMDPSIFNSMQWDGGDMVAVFGKTHPLAKLDSVTPQQLLNEEYYTLSLSNDMEMRNRCTERCMKLLGRVPPNVRYIDDTESIDILLSGGRGFTLLNGHLNGYYKPSLLSFVRVDGPSVRQNVRFVWRKENENPALPQFIEVAEMVRARYQDCSPTSYV